MRKKQPPINPTVYFYTRSPKKEIARLNIMVQRGKIRKFVNSPIIATLPELEQFKTSGEPKEGAKYNKTIARQIRRMRAAVIAIVTPLMREGTFADITSAELTDRVLNLFNGEGEA